MRTRQLLCYKPVKKIGIFILKSIALPILIPGLQQNYGTIECANSATCFFNADEGTALPGFGIANKFPLLTIDLGNQVGDDADTFCITGMQIFQDCATCTRSNSPTVQDVTFRRNVVADATIVVP